MQLRIWLCQTETEEAILIATEEYWARKYADQMGFHGPLKEIVQPTAIIRELDPDEIVKPE